MEKPIIVTKVNCNQFVKVKNLAQSVYQRVSDNPNFINTQPSLFVIKECLDDLTDALTNWGLKGNKGSHEDYINLQTKTKIMHIRLTQLCGWCMSSLDVGLSYPDQKQILSTSGFPLKNARTPVGRLSMVRDLRRLIVRNLSLDMVKLKWKKPLEVVTNTNVKNYNVYRNTTDDFASASILTSIPYTTYIDNPGSGTWFYWVVPTNNMGSGVPSNCLMVKVA